MTKKKRKGNRAKYIYWITKEGQALIKDMVRNGYVNEEIAKKIGIAEGTLYEWQKHHPEIQEALKDNKEVSNAKVENETFRMATGYFYPDQVMVKTKITRYVDGVKEVVETSEPVTIERWKPAEPTINQFWLKNRRPEVWKDKQEVNLTSETPLQVIIKSLEGEKY